MPHFLFHLHECGQVTADTEGKELPDLATARAHAADAARHIMCSEVIDGKLCLGCYIDIENRDDGAHTRVDFRDTLDITAPSN